MSFSTLPYHLLFSIPLFYSFVYSYQQVCNHGDQSSLLALSLNLSTSSPTPLNWSSLTTCCEWEGVDCDTNGRVTHLQLPYRGLKGVISSSVANLTRLAHLNLSNNYIHGGFLGEAIAALTSLQIIDLSSNSIVGPIPREIDKLLHLQKLHLYNNSLSGPIPSTLMKCTQLKEIILRDNHLHGDISTLNFSSLAQLQKLDLRNNSLNGSLPESIYSCKSLVAIRVALNNITGQILPRVVELKSLSFISLSQNSLTNAAETLGALAKCNSLTSLLLSVNFFGEPLPVHRTFIGSDGFRNLQFLGLGSCNFGGPIPQWLSNLRRLRVLNLSGNNLSGTIPNWLGDLPNLSRLMLSNNNLSGEFPPNLCNLPSLVSQNIESNFKYFHFEFPVFALDAGHTTYNQYNAFYQGISVSYNSLTGAIPAQIDRLQNLQMLDLSYNHFSSEIPDSVSRLENLEVLNLARNDFTGEIPASLRGLHFLSHFDVSYNDLEGPIPIGGQFDTFQHSSFEGNSGLCGKPLDRTCSIITGSKEMDRNRSDRGEMQQFLDGVFVGFASGWSGVIAVVVSIVLFKRCKQTGCFPTRE